MTDKTPTQVETPAVALRSMAERKRVSPVLRPVLINAADLIETLQGDYMSAWSELDNIADLVGNRSEVGTYAQVEAAIETLQQEQATLKAQLEKAREGWANAADEGPDIQAERFATEKALQQVTAKDAEIGVIKKALAFALTDNEAKDAEIARLTEHNETLQDAVVDLSRDEGAIVRHLRAEIARLRQALESYDGYMAARFSGPDSDALHPRAAAMWNAARDALDARSDGSRPTETSE